MPANFGNLNPLPNFNALLMDGFNTGRTIRRQQDTEKALAAAIAAPDDPHAFNALLTLDPSRAFALRNFQHKEQDFQRGETFRSALAAYGPPGAAQPTGSGELGDTNAVVPQSTGPGQPDQPQPSNARDAAFLRMWQADPVRAMEIDSEMRDNALKRIKVVREAYGWAAQQLGGATDEASYQAAKKGFADRLAEIGIDVPQEGVPQNYPGPEGIRALLMRAAEAEDQLAALDRRDRLEWDVADDVEDNERADRNTDSLIGDRAARRGLIARGQNITSTDRRRGQDMTDKRLRETGGGRGRGSARVVSVRTPEEARALPAGTVFRTPDGRVKVR